jgi:adenosylcobinamide-phosphate synthase
VGWIALVLTLILEQMRPMPAREAVSALAATIADGAEHNMNAGRRRHGVYAWLLIVVVGGLLVAGLHALALWINVLLALLLNVLVLYVTLGFRQFSHRFTEIQLALDHGDLAAARRELTEWKRSADETYSAADLSAEEVVRQAIEYGLLLSHKHVFGVLFWFVLLPGPVGPVVYRLAEYLARRWNRASPASSPLPPDRFGEFAARALAWIEWLPARLTALGFAIVGDFEGAVYCWRRCVHVGTGAKPGWPDPDTRTLLLCAASGATGVRVMSAAESARYLDESGNEGGGLVEPEVRTLRTVVGLVWRALVLWLLLLLLLTIVAWLA